MAIKPSIKKDVFSKFFNHGIGTQLFSKTLQLLNFNFSVQFGDIESIYFLTAPNLQTEAGFNTVVLMLLISRSYRVVF